MTRTPTRQVFKGLLAAALVAWLIMTLLPLADSLVSEFSRDRGARSDVWQQAFGVLMLFAVFGLPIALIATLIVGYPAWRNAERLGFQEAKWGIVWGAICGSIISVISTAMKVFGASPGTTYGGSQGNEMIDGRLTTLGWTHEFQGLVFVAITGALAGYIAVRGPNAQNRLIQCQNRTLLSCRTLRTS